MWRNIIGYWKFVQLRYSFRHVAPYDWIKKIYQFTNAPSRLVYIHENFGVLSRQVLKFDFHAFHVQDFAWFLHTWFLHVKFFLLTFACMIIISSWKLFLCTFMYLILYDFLMHDFVAFFVCGARFYVGRPILMTQLEFFFFKFKREFFGPSQSVHG